METIDILWHGLNSANRHLNFKEEITGIHCELFTTGEMIESAKHDKNFMSELTPSDKIPTKSAVGKRTPPWTRQFLNTNSNKLFRKYKLVEDVPYESLDGHFRMLSVGRNITSKQELIKHIYRIDNNLYIEKPNAVQSPYHDAAKRTKQITKTTMVYPSATSANKKYLVNRSEGKCESCGKKLDLNKTADGLLFNAHHIYDPKSTDVIIISKYRLEHVNDMAAVCGSCHQHIHDGIDGDRYNIELRAKVKAINELVDVGDVEKAAIVRKQIIINRD